jgi:hypothetical protein
MTTAAIPNLWEGKFSKHAASPLAVFRTHAGNFNSQSAGLLRAEVEHRIEEREGGRFRVISFDIVAPSLDYRLGVFVAEHAEPGAYPVAVRSGFLNDPHRVTPRPLNSEPDTHVCYTQAELIKSLDVITGSSQLQVLIESLIAQINDTNPGD